MPVAEMTNISSEEIMRIAEKVKQNEEEQKIFESNLHDLIENDTKINKPLTIGATPNSIVICGADSNLDYTISKSVVDKCLKPEIRDENGKLTGKTGHGLTEQQLLSALENVKTPPMVLKGNKPNSLVVVTDINDNLDRQILVAINLNKQGNSAEINDVSSAYGRQDFARYIEQQNEKGNTIAMHKEKANKLFQSIGKKYPEPDKFISFDNSIAYSTANVKYPENIISEPTHFYEAVDHETLLPFLNAKAEFHEMRLDNLQSKRDRQESKLQRNEDKINKLSEKVSQLEDMNKALSAISDKIPMVKAIIDSNEERIKTINEQKIPNREAKITYHKHKIAEIDAKSAVIGHKHDRAVALSDTIKSFALFGTERRQRFAEAMDRLNSSSLNCLNDKKQDIANRIDKQTNIYNSSLTTTADKLSIQENISKLQGRLSDVDKKIQKLSAKSEKYTEKSFEQLDDSMNSISQAVDKSINAGELNINKLSEDICFHDDESEPNIRNEEINRDISDNPLKNVEMSMEQNYNDIDGIINNLPTIDVKGHFLVPEFEEKTYSLDEFNKTLALANENWQNNERREGQSAKIKLNIKLDNGESYERALPMEANFATLSDFLSYDDFAGSYEHLTNTVLQAEAAISGLSSAVETAVADSKIDDSIENSTQTVNNWLSEMINSGKAVVSDDGYMRINQDYYKELPRSDRHIEEFSRSEGENVMNELIRNDIEFSATTRSNGNIAITVSENDVSALEKIGSSILLAERFEALQAAAEKELEEDYKDFSISNFDKDDLLNALKTRETKDIELSLNALKGIIPDNERFAILDAVREQSATEVKKIELTENEAKIMFGTLSEAEEAMAERAMNSEKNSASNIINSDFYKSLPKKDRFTQSFSSKDAQDIMNSLNNSNIPYSAVIKGDTTKITVTADDKNALQNSRDTRYINPDFYKSLNSSERFTQQMSEKQARDIVNELSSKGVEHSAVLNGDKSKVTIRQSDFKENKRILMTRQKMNDSAKIAKANEKAQDRSITNDKKRDVIE